MVIESKKKKKEDDDWPKNHTKQIVIGLVIMKKRKL